MVVLEGTPFDKRGHRFALASCPTKWYIIVLYVDILNSKYYWFMETDLVSKADSGIVFHRRQKTGVT